MDAVQPQTEFSAPEPRVTIWKPLLAAALSLLLPGLGQALNRQPRKAAGISGAALGIVLLVGVTDLLHTFAGLVTYVSGEFIFRVVVAVDAFRSARRQRKTLGRPSRNWKWGGAGPPHLVERCGDRFFLRIKTRHRLHDKLPAVR